MCGDVVLVIGEAGPADEGAHCSSCRLNRNHCGRDSFGISFGANVCRKRVVVRVLGSILRNRVERCVDLETSTKHLGVALFVSGTKTSIGKKLLTHLLNEVTLFWRLCNPAAIGGSEARHNSSATTNGEWHCVELGSLRTGDHAVVRHPVESKFALTLRLLWMQDWIIAHGV
ncbi:unannotated protein [freshwater metagenome]|uniref:Unannotated protein n=1 Tax=freshwater metagenome TaxID=449393 RepID=A0A6J6NL02_9ZZZZ